MGDCGYPWTITKAIRFPVPRWKVWCSPPKNVQEYAHGGEQNYCRLGMDLFLIFVDNADSGIFNAAADLAHKMFSPETYECNLCALTYRIGMRDEWKQFISNLDAHVEFLHKDELSKKYGVEGVPLPAVFYCEHGKLEVWASAEEINACESLEDLEQLITSKTS